MSNCPQTVDQLSDCESCPQEKLNCFLSLLNVDVDDTSTIFTFIHPNHYSGNNSQLVCYTPVKGLNSYPSGALTSRGYILSFSSGTRPLVHIPAPHTSVKLHSGIRGYLNTSATFI